MHRQLAGAPLDALRILTVSSAVLAYACAAWVVNHSGPPWLWVISAVSLVPAAAAGAAWTVRNHRAPDRLAIPMTWDNRPWFVGLALVIAATIGAARAMVTEGWPGVLLGTPVFAVGAGILTLVVRHLRKPVRPPDRIAPKHDPWEDEPPRPGWRGVR